MRGDGGILKSIGVYLAAAAAVAGVCTLLEAFFAVLGWLAIVRGDFEQRQIPEKGYVADFLYRLAIAAVLRVRLEPRTEVESSPV